MRFLAISTKRDKPVIQTSTRDALDRIISEGEYDRRDLTLIQWFTGFDGSQRHVAIASQLFSLGVLT